MIDTYLLLSAMLMLPFLIKVVIIRVWPDLTLSVWINIIFTVLFVVGLIILGFQVFGGSDGGTTVVRGTAVIRR